MLNAREFGMMSFQNIAMLGPHMPYAFNALTVIIEEFLGHTHISVSLFWWKKILNVEKCLVGQYILKPWLQVSFIAVEYLMTIFARAGSGVL